MQSASPTSSFSSPQRSRPNSTATVSPAGAALRHLGRRLGRADHRLGLVVGACGGREHEAAIGDRRFDAVEQLGTVEHHVGARGGAAGMDVRPGVARPDEPQPGQAEIRHGARRGADVLAELRLDQHDDRSVDGGPFLGVVGS